MKVTDQITKSISGTFRAFSLLSKMRLNWIYILPVLIYVLIFTMGFGFTNGIHDSLMSFIEDKMEDWITQYSFLEYLMNFSSVLFWIIIKLTLFLLLGILSGYVALIVLSPIYAWISEKTEEKIRGEAYPFNLSKFIKDVLRAIVIALRNGVIQITWTVVLFILSFIPVLNFITAPLLFIITAYFYGFSFLDYSHERLGLSMKESIQEVRSLKFAAVCLGSIFLFLCTIPWIGTFFGSMISFHLVTSGTLLVLEKKNGHELTLNVNR